MTDHLSLPALCAGALIAAMCVLGPASEVSADSYAAFARVTAGGALDTSFDGGKFALTFDNAPDARANAAVLQADGKIVAVGTAASKFLVVRLLSNGDVDPTFAGDGSVLTDFTPSVNEAARAVAIDSSGRIVVAGHADGKFALARYLSNGQLDTSFDGDGKVITDLYSYYPGTLEFVHAVALTSDGKIIVAGEIRWPINGIAVARYNANGSIDTTFNGGSFSIRMENRHEHVSVGHAIAIASGGKVVIAGEALMTGPEQDGWMFAAVRLNANGTLDTTFSGDGKVTIPFDSAEFGAGAHAVAVDSAGKVVLGGTARGLDGNQFALVRLNTNGSLDTTFGGDGKALTDVTAAHASEAYALRIQSNGKIVAAGRAGDLMAAVRYNTSGSLDNTFDGNGKLSVRIIAENAETVHAVLVDTSGRIVLVGVSEDPPTIPL